MLKVSSRSQLLTVVLRELGLISLIAPLFAPVTTLLDCRGMGCNHLLAGFTNTIYASLATAAALDLTSRQITILGVVLGIAHSLFVETGSPDQFSGGDDPHRTVPYRVGLVSWHDHACAHACGNQRRGIAADLQAARSAGAPPSCRSG